MNKLYTILLSTLTILCGHIVSLEMSVHCCQETLYKRVECWLHYIVWFKSLLLVTVYQVLLPQKWCAVCEFQGEIKTRCSCFVVCCSASGRANQSGETSIPKGHNVNVTSADLHLPCAFHHLRVLTHQVFPFPCVKVWSLLYGARLFNASYVKALSSQSCQIFLSFNPLSTSQKPPTWWVGRLNSQFEISFAGNHWIKQVLRNGQDLIWRWLVVSNH